jgi:DNA-binding MltR family transcriptional regulator
MVNKMTDTAKKLISKEDNAYLKTLAKEEDLPCVLIGTAAIDERLESLLRKYLKEGKTANRLFKDTGPLGSLRAKADFCYLLNIIDDRMHHTLLLLLEIRDLFTDSMFEMSFESKQIEKRSAELRAMWSGLASFENNTKSSYALLVVLVKSILLMTSKYIKKSKPRHPKEFKMMFNSEAAD